MLPQRPRQLDLTTGTRKGERDCTSGEDLLLGARSDRRPRDRKRRTVEPEREHEAQSHTLLIEHETHTAAVGDGESWAADSDS